MKKAIHLGLLYTLFLLATGVEANEQRLQALQHELIDEADSVMSFWLQYGPDQEYGGFHGRLAEDGEPLEPDQKGLIQQSRHLWTLSTWHPYAGYEADKVEALADETFGFLRDHFLDDDGEFIFMVERDGDPLDTKKLIYAESFAIYGLSQYALRFNSNEAQLMAIRCFESLDRRVHDKRYLGYDQTNDPGWLADGAQKGTNTHIHLLEAFTKLYELTGDATVKARLEEMIDVVLYKIIQPEGYAHLEFYRDWRPHAEPRVSYGHDLETAWLLIEAYRVLGREPDREARDIIELFGSHSANRGFDNENGGYFNYGAPGGEADNKDKIWWVQAEAIAGNWWLYHLTGESGYLDKLEATLTYSQAYLKDSEHGGWYDTRLENGELGSNGTLKGHVWKTNYHLVRALVFTQSWIQDYLSGD